MDQSTAAEAAGTVVEVAVAAAVVAVVGAAWIKTQVWAVDTCLVKDNVETQVALGLDQLTWSDKGPCDCPYDEGRHTDWAFHCHTN